MTPTSITFMQNGIVGTPYGFFGICNSSNFTSPATVLLANSTNVTVTNSNGLFKVNLENGSSLTANVTYYVYFRRFSNGGSAYTQFNYSSLNTSFIKYHDGVAFGSAGATSFAVEGNAPSTPSSITLTNTAPTNFSYIESTNTPIFSVNVTTYSNASGNYNLTLIMNSTAGTLAYAILNNLNGTGYYNLTCNTSLTNNTKYYYWFIANTTNTTNNAATQRSSVYMAGTTSSCLVNNGGWYSRSPTCTITP
jgi:hypothetical protein